MSIKKVFIYIIFSFLIGSLFVRSILAAEPTAPYLQFRWEPKTGSGTDNSGDGGGGGGFNLHEYYVGQEILVGIEVNTGGYDTTGVDAIISYDTNYLKCNVVCGNTYEGCDSKTTVDPTGEAIAEIAVYNTTQGKYYNGMATVASLQCTVLRQRTAMYVTDNPLPINFYVLPAKPNGDPETTDSNITQAVTSRDILSDVENAQIHLWPDTNAPYVDNWSTTETAGKTNTNSTVKFNFRDKSVFVPNTSGDETGVVPSSLGIYYREWNRGSGSYGGQVGIGYTASAYSCSGTWNFNDCAYTINPSYVSGNGNRRFKYDAKYQVCTQNGTDRAIDNNNAAATDADGYLLPYQNPVGPNMMVSPTCFEFETVLDTGKPMISAQGPTGNAVVVDSNISFTIQDLNGTVHGTGINKDTIMVTVQSTHGVDMFTCNTAGVTCVAQTNNGLTYGYQVTIDPDFNFNQNETVIVKVSGANDYATTDGINTPNVMDDFSWSFTTVDGLPPVLLDFDPVCGATESARVNTNTFEFTIADSGVGVDLTTIQVMVQAGDKQYLFTRDGNDVSGNLYHFTYTGDTNAYVLTVDMSVFGGLPENQTFGISVVGADVSGNTIDPNQVCSFATYVTAAEDCPSCPICPTPEPTPTPNPDSNSENCNEKEVLIDNGECHCETIVSDFGSTQAYELPNANYYYAPSLATCLNTYTTEELCGDERGIHEESLLLSNIFGGDKEINQGSCRYFWYCLWFWIMLMIIAGLSVWIGWFFYRTKQWKKALENREYRTGNIEQGI